MRALLKKELTEVLVPFGAAFLVIAMAWIGSVQFWDALLPPATTQLMVVGISSAIAGAVLGYLQFSAERWRGKFGYLCHRGTGVQGSFLAKSIAGLIGTLLIGLGPPLVYALSASLFSPNASILQASVLWDYASASTAGVSLYALGALAASLRRRSIMGVLSIPIGGFGLWVISELCGTPWNDWSSTWTFPVLQLAVAAVLLGLVVRLARSSVDRDLPLPRGVHVAAVLLAMPLVLLPCEIGASGLQFSLLDEVRSNYPTILPDRQTGEIFPVVRGPRRESFRLGPGGQLGSPVDINGHSGLESAFETVFTGRNSYGSSAAGPTDGSAEWADGRVGRGALIPIGIRHQSLTHDSALYQSVRINLDLRRGVVSAYNYVTDYGRHVVPFEVELGKPDGSTFSSATIVLGGEEGAVRRLIQSASPDDLEEFPQGVLVVTPNGGRSGSSGVLLHSCLFDPSDGSFWRLDALALLEGETPLVRVDLPGGDRFVQLQTLYRRSDLVFGRYVGRWTDPLVVGEKDGYVWNGRELVPFVGSEANATLDETEGLIRYHVVVQDPDPLRWTVRVEDVKENREVFAYDFAPRPGGNSVAAAAAQASVLLRSPLANTLIFMGNLRIGPNRVVENRSEFLGNGRRPWLLALDLVIAFGCVGIAARILRRRLASPIRIGLGCAFVLLFGPAGLLVVWILEPKGRAREISATRVVPEPALVIQSA